MQYERATAISRFKAGQAKVLISTNVASRGLDIPQIHTIINYEPAKDKDDHTHRIGRTGRAGDKTGVAYTLLMRSDYQKAGTSPSQTGRNDGGNPRDCGAARKS